MLTSIELVGALANQRVDASHAGTDGGLRHDIDGTDLTDVVDMGTTAELAAPTVLANGDHTHHITVLFTEQVHGTKGDGIVELHFLGGDGKIVAQTMI